LSFKNPHHLFDGDFLFYKILQLCGSPDSYRGSVAFFLKTLFLTKRGFFVLQNPAVMWEPR
ncbi:hypothetical protein ACHRV1_12765, partial [Flavobacterium aquidurense]|uniref:hypothetical protein n=1 Tax=Flavobacterium aquidurense TaxID=362413 RepID=UPI003756AB18